MLLFKLTFLWPCFSQQQCHWLIFQLILMSATMNSKLFSQYFGVSVQNRMLEPPTLEVEGQLFSVSVFYVDDLKCLGEV